MVNSKHVKMIYLSDQCSLSDFTWTFSLCSTCTIQGVKKKKKLFQPYKGTTIKSFEKHIRWMSALVLSILFLEKCPFLLLSVTNVLQKERNISENRNETRYKAKDKRVSSITWQVLKPFGNSIKPTKTERKKILVNNLLWH